jgi:hypothetical protein
VDRRTFLATAGAAAAGVAGFGSSERTKSTAPMAQEGQVVYVDLRVVDAELDHGIWTYTLAEQVASGRSSAVVVVKAGGQSTWQPGDLILGSFYRYAGQDPGVNDG